MELRSDAFAFPEREDARHELFDRLIGRKDAVMVVVYGGVRGGSNLVCGLRRRREAEEKDAPKTSGMLRSSQTGKRSSTLYENSSFSSTSLDAIDRV